MSRITTMVQTLPAGWNEGVSWVAGLGITLGLFSWLARIELPPVPPPGIEEVHLVSLPADLPPPPSRPIAPPVPQPVVPVLGIDPGPSDSPVHIRVLPAEVEDLITRSPRLPRQLDTVARIPAVGPPRADEDVDVRRIYQQSEVDQPPRAIVRSMPSIPRDLFGKLDALRVVLLLTIDRNGDVENIRIADASGQPIYDRLVVEYVRSSWQFSAAIRRGQRVRCFAQQSVSTLAPGGANPFYTR